MNKTLFSVLYNKAVLPGTYTLGTIVYTAAYSHSKKCAYIKFLFFFLFFCLASCYKPISAGERLPASSKGKPFYPTRQNNAEMLFFPHQNTMSTTHGRNLRFKKY